MKNKALVLCLLPALAACGGTTTPPVATTRTAPATLPVNPMSATVFDTVAIAYDDPTDAFSFTVNSVAATELTEELTYNNGRLRSFTDPGGDEYAYAHASANAIAAVMASDGNMLEASGTGVYGGITYRRIGAASVALTGNANFSGDYAGYMREDLNGPNDQVLYRVNGDVIISADFANNLVNGSITGRELRDYFLNTPVAIPVADVTLQNTLLDGNIAYAGNATGGEITSGTWASAPGGTYSGLFAGPEAANETVGGVIINHLNGAVAHTEIGIFAAALPTD